MEEKIKALITLIIILIINMSVVEASSGKLRSNSIITCDGIMYGQHSSDNHWHVAIKRDNGYYPSGSAIYSNPCIEDDTEIIVKTTKEVTTHETKSTIVQKKEIQETKTTTQKTTLASKENTTTTIENNIDSTKETSNDITIVEVGVFGGIGYGIYRLVKKKKKA